MARKAAMHVEHEPAPIVTGGMASARARTASWWLRWLPLAVATIGCVVLLGAFDTPLGSVAATIGYYTLLVAAPGTLLWRLLGVRTVSFLEEVALGTALGLAVQVALRWALSYAGKPQWAWCWIIAVLVAGARPRWRRVWRSASPRTAPVVAWTTATVVLIAAWWTANTSFRFSALAAIPGRPGEYYAPEPYVDMPFHQALAWSVDAAQPTDYPHVAGVPLQYTMMVYEHIADLHQWTHTDLSVAVLRLWVLPMLALTVVLCATLTVRLSGARSWGGLGAVLGVLSAPWALYGWLRSPFFGTGTLNIGVFHSPTQTFGEPLFLALVTVICSSLVSSAARRPRLLVVIGILAFAAGGSKATFLPIVLCGLLLVLARAFLTRRPERWFIGAVALNVAAALCAVLLAVTGTNARALSLSTSLQFVAAMPIVGALGDIRRPEALVIAVFLLAIAWLAVGAGAYFLVRHRARDPRVWFLTTMVLAGAGGVLVAYHPGYSQVYFLFSVWPLVGVLCAWGLLVAVRRLDVPRVWWRGLIVVAMATGCLAVIATWLGTRWIGPHITSGWPAAAALLGTVLALMVILGLIATALDRAPHVRARVRPARRSHLVVTVVAALLIGGSLSEHIVNGTLLPPPVSALPDLSGPATPADGAQAARYIRAHSAPGERIATNGHCVGDGDPWGTCQAVHFWVAALAERPALVEGWWFATPSAAQAPGFVGVGPYWDSELLRLNDAAFGPSSGPAIQELGERHEVRWLLVDRTTSVEDESVSDHALLVLDLPDAAVYRIDARAAAQAVGG